ncbi:hypothetical protein [Arthrobacter mobilis]|uniref:hypothetical protein n=1 Tax=Arthrobacter mobilis TaxID=2724944 RepID=UPI001447E670|nr:hypothetical protein [Arthrobacter mobilis]
MSILPVIHRCAPAVCREEATRVPYAREMCGRAASPTVWATAVSGPEAMVPRSLSPYLPASVRPAESVPGGRTAGSRAATARILVAADQAKARPWTAITRPWTVAVVLAAAAIAGTRCSCERRPRSASRAAVPPSRACSTGWARANSPARPLSQPVTAWKRAAATAARAAATPPPASAATPAVTKEASAAAPRAAATVSAKSRVSATSSAWACSISAANIRQPAASDSQPAAISRAQACRS